MVDAQSKIVALLLILAIILLPMSSVYASAMTHGDQFSSDTHSSMAVCEQVDHDDPTCMDHDGNGLANNGSGECCKVQCDAAPSAQICSQLSLLPIPRLIQDHLAFIARNVESIPPASPFKPPLV